MNGPSRPAPVKMRNGKGWLFFSLLVLLLLALILPPLINLNRYQRRIAASISSSLGRPVEMSSVKLTLLPLPGLAMSNFVVEEDPAFGAEPTLRSANVTAYLRLTSLWRGKLEISRISLDEPSLNLVHTSAGRWNIGSLLLQASHVPNAPTSQRYIGYAPRFPYIEANNGRVNFKEGLEKRPFSLLNADFSMWLADPGQWRLRVEAQPVRTDLDLDLSDTGLLRIEGSLKRASALGNMPVHLTATWSKAPLGELARLLLGHDLGWRGDLYTETEITGDAHALQFKSRLRVDDLHRQEFTPSETIQLEPTCLFVYRRDRQIVDGLNCTLPTGDGSLSLKGSLGSLAQPAPNLTIGIDRLPASFVLTALRTLHQGFAPGLETKGSAHGSFTYQATAPSSVLEGGMTIDTLSLNAPELKTPLELEPIHLTASGKASPAKATSHHGAPAVPDRTSVELTPFSLPGNSLTLAGTLTRAGFELHMNGASTIDRLTSLARSFGLSRSSVAALGPQGTAAIALTLRGPWTTAVAATPRPLDVEGTMRLQNAIYNSAFLPAPVELLSAEANFSPSEVVWSPVSAAFQHIPFTLSLTVPKNCTGPDCAVLFNASTASLDAGVLERALTGNSNRGALLGEIMTRIDATLSPGKNWPAASGVVRANTFLAGPMVMRNMTASLQVQGRSVALHTLDARTLGGTLHASGALDAVSGAPPSYNLSFVLTRAAATEAAALFHENWGSGELSASGDLKLSGYSRAALASSARGTFHAAWDHGASTLLGSFEHWDGSGTVDQSRLTLTRSSLTRGSTGEPLSGSIGFDRQANLTVGTLHLVGPMQPQK